MKKKVTIIFLSALLFMPGLASAVSENDFTVKTTEQRTLSGGAIGTGAGAIAGHTIWGAAIGAAAGAAGGFLYDHHEKGKQAEYEKSYQAGLQSAEKSQ